MLCHARSFSVMDVVGHLGCNSPGDCKLIVLHFYISPGVLPCVAKKQCSHHIPQITTVDIQPDGKYNFRKNSAVDKLQKSLRLILLSETKRGQEQKVVLTAAEVCRWVDSHFHRYPCSPSARVIPHAYNTFQLWLRMCITAMSCAHLPWGTHSLRRGGASEMARVGVPMTDIMAYGRWAFFRAAQTYVQRGEVPLLQVGDTFPPDAWQTTRSLACIGAEAWSTFDDSSDSKGYVARFCLFGFVCRAVLFPSGVWEWWISSAGPRLFRGAASGARCAASTTWCIGDASWQWPSSWVQKERIPRGGTAAGDGRTIEPRLRWGLFSWFTCCAWL